MSTAVARAVVPAHPRRHHRPLDRGTAISVGTALTAVVVALLAGPLVDRAQVGVLVAGLLIGLPHGATDHVVAQRLLGRRSPAPVVAGYAVVAVAGFAAFRLWPLPSVLVFAAVSAAHFATGETEFALARRPGGSQNQLPIQLVLAATVFALPVLAHPGAIDHVLAATLHSRSSDGLAYLGNLRWVLVTAVAAMIVVALMVLAGRRRWLDAAELALLVVLFTVVTPLAAFGVYFGGWHSVRHVGRLLNGARDGATAFAPGDPGAPSARFARDAALPTAAALLVVGLLRWQAGSWLAFVGADLALLAGLTLPHLVVVALYDRMTRPTVTAPPPAGMLTGTS